MVESINSDKQLFLSLDMGNENLSKKEKTERKIYKRIAKNNYKFRHKIERDMSSIRDIVAKLDADSTIKMISNVFDSPNVVNSFVDDIELLYISTWSVTPAGIAALENISRNGKCKEAILLMDKTHSYKWIFADGAYAILKDSVKIRFCACHSKFIAMQMVDGSYLTIVGSMNWSNNPRWENIEMTKSKADFDFYSDFVKNVPCEELKNGR